MLACLACRAGVRAYADAAYRDGLGYTEFPAEDVPGRLEAYDEAHRRAPGTFVYLLRSGQIHLARAAAGAREEQHLTTAGERLREAVRIHPLDARARISLAQVLLLEGDASAAYESARVAASLGRRHPLVQLAGVRLGIEAWTRTGDIEGLALALDAELVRWSWRTVYQKQESRAENRRRRVPRFVLGALSTRRDDALGDLLEAAGQRLDRLDVAIAWTAVDRPDIAEILAARRRRIALRDASE